jgi:hypothetical protein
MSNNDVEREIPGGRVLRHKARATESEHAADQAVNCEEIEAHLARHIGEVKSVFHEIVSDIVHLDVLFVPPAEDRPFNLLVTSGVGDLPMTVPEGCEELRRCELMIALPADWKLAGEGADDESNYWPIRWLKMVGRLPHEYRTWLGHGHTIPNGDPPTRIADTKFVGAMISGVYPFPEGFDRLRLQSGEVLNFYLLVPLYAEEMDVKLEKGSDEIFERFNGQKIDLVLDTKRPNVALKRGWLRW